MTYTRGDFSFLPANQKTMLDDAFKAMEAVEGSWKYMALHSVPEKNSGFIFSRDPFISTISARVDTDGRIGHSGSSYGWTMRQIEYIAKNGWDDYVTRSLQQLQKEKEDKESRKLAETQKKTKYFTDSFFKTAREISPFKAQIKEAEALADSQGGKLSYSQMRSIMG